MSDLHPKFAGKVVKQKAGTRGLNEGQVARIRFDFGLWKREDLNDDFIREGWGVEPEDFEAFLEYQDFIVTSQTPPGELNPWQKLRNEIIKKRRG